MLKVKDPKNWNDLRTYENKLYDTFVDAAIARKLLKDEKIFEQTANEAFATKRTVRQRIRWLAVFFSVSMLSEPSKMLDHLLKLRDNWLVGTRVAGQSLEVRRQYVLRAMEFYLRVNGVRPSDVAREDGTFESACERICLPRPEGLNIGPQLLIQVIIFCLFKYF